MQSNKSAASQVGDIQGSHLMKTPKSRQSRERIQESNDTSLITDEEIDQYIKEEYVEQK